jgi:CBS domain-containing protein
MKVRDVMTINVKSCWPETNLAEVARMMWENDCGILPVINGDGKLIGTITDRDIAIAVGTKNRLASEITVGEVMPRGVVVTALADEDVKSALKTMREAAVRRLPIMDSRGIVRGIVSMSDILLQARPDVKDPSYEHIVSTFKGICEHQTTRTANA